MNPLLRSSGLVALGAFALGVATGIGLVTFGREGGLADPHSAVQAASHAPRVAAAESGHEAPWPELLSSVLVPPPTGHDSTAVESVRSGGGARAGDAPGEPPWPEVSDEAIEAILAGMSDVELVETVTGTSLFSAEELEDLRDVRDFAERLASIALSGVVTPVSELPADAGAVSFARSVGPDNTAAGESELFYSDAGRIYAVFPSDQYGRDSVLVKWQRLDRPELLVFDRYPIHPDDAYSYVWLGQPEGWSAGSYEVTMYSVDESLEPIAVGGYDVADDLALAEVE